MPLVNVDVKSLELVVAAQLSGDKTMSQEIINRVDLHSENQNSFKLGEGKEGRLVSKILSFRIIYGGGAFSFANDPDFMGVSTSQKYWEVVIDKWYNKYNGVKEWHNRLIVEAQTDGFITIPSGRYFPITPDYTKKEPWPLTIIKNYPVQGFGADLVALARLRVNQLLKDAGIEALLVGTIHDSIVVDCRSKNVSQVANILKQAIEEVPSLVRKLFNYDFSLPLTCEVAYGPNKKDMTDQRCCSQTRFIDLRSLTHPLTLPSMIFTYKV